MTYEIPSRKRRNAEDADYSAPWSVELLDENNSFLCNGKLFCRIESGLYYYLFSIIKYPSFYK